MGTPPEALVSPFGSPDSIVTLVGRGGRLSQTHSTMTLLHRGLLNKESDVGSKSTWCFLSPLSP